MFIRAPQGPSGKNLDMSTSHKKDWNVAHHFSTTLDVLEMMIQENQEDVEQATASKQCILHSFHRWIKIPTRSKAARFLKNRDIYCLRWSYAQKSNGSVLCQDIFLTEPPPRSSTSKMDMKGSRKHNSKKEKHSPTKKNRRDRNTPRDTSGHKSTDPETSEMEGRLGETSSGTQIFSCTQQKQRDLCSKQCVPEEAEQAQYSTNVVKRLEGAHTHKKRIPK